MLTFACCAVLWVSPPQESAPAVGSAFQRLLWRHDDAPPPERLVPLLRTLGLTGVSVARGEDPRPWVEAGASFYLDQACGKGVLELRDAEFEAVRARYLEARDPKTLVRPAVLSDPAVRGVAREQLERSLAALRGARPWAVALADEASATRHRNPLDLCHAPASLAAFHAFLRARHGDLGRLNLAWDTRYLRWEEVVPFTFDTLLDERWGGATLPENLRPWSEHREFMDQEFAGLVRELVRESRHLLPDVPVGLTGLQPPAPYGGHDPAQMVPGLSFLEIYDLGGAAALVGSLQAPHTRVVATLFPPAQGQPNGVLRARLAELAARGADGVVVWSSREVLGEDGQASAHGRAIADALRELDPALNACAGATIRHDPVWIVESHASVRAHWVFDAAADGARWVNRRSSYQDGNSTAMAARLSWLRCCEDLGITPRFVIESELAERLGVEPPKVLVLPALLALSDRSAQAVRRFADGGGLVVADHGTGIYDQYLVRRRRPALDAMFGIVARPEERSAYVVREGRAAERARLPSGLAVAELGLRGHLAEPVASGHVQIESPVGRGRAVYLNLAVCEYAALRLDERSVGPAQEVRRRLRRWLQEAGVEPAVDVRGTGLPTCIARVQLRGRDGSTLVCVRVNAVERPEVLARLAAEGPRQVQVAFRTPVRLRDLVRGTAHPAATVHTLPFDPWTGLFLRVEAGGP